MAINGSEAVVSDLPSYHFFHFAVRAGNEAGWSEWSDVSYGLTNPRHSKWWPDPHPAPAEPAPGPGAPVTGFTLVDATTGEDVGTIVPGATLDLAARAGHEFNVRAEIKEGSDLGSVRLELTGPQGHSQTEVWAPYALYGADAEGNAGGAQWQDGDYRIRAVPYTKDRPRGLPLQTLAVDFTVDGMWSADPSLLRALELSGLALDFDHDVAGYAVTAPVDVEIITVTATAMVATSPAVIEPADVDAATDGHQVAVELGENTVTVQVYSPENVLLNTYTTVITVGFLPEGCELYELDTLVATGSWESGCESMYRDVSYAPLLPAGSTQTGRGGDAAAVRHGQSHRAAVGRRDRAGSRRGFGRRGGAADADAGRGDLRD